MSLCGDCRRESISLRFGCHHCIIMAANVWPMLVGTGIEWEGALSCHTYSHMEPKCLWSKRKDRQIKLFSHKQWIMMK